MPFEKLVFLYDQPYVINITMYALQRWKYKTFPLKGIIGTDSHWSSGLWILHNNLFFPQTKGSTLTIPGSKSWYMATVGDSEADIFYICLSVGMLCLKSYIRHANLYVVADLIWWLWKLLFYLATFFMSFSPPSR